MTEKKQNIAIYKFLGHQPNRMWRFFYDEERTRCTIGLNSEKQARESIERCKLSWLCESCVFSEPEEYDDWGHISDVDLDTLQGIKESLTFDQQTEYAANLLLIFKDFPMTNAFLAGEKEQKEALLRALNLWED